ncbi:MAG TPA: hypothetical protein VG826_16565 [Pirellulales bacterium]|nr:hypothetical protein [Pirellulales bacterium]
MYSRASASILALSTVFLFAASPADAQFEPLAASVPSSANAIALVDVKNLFDSPLAAREGWKDKHDQAFAAGLCAIPPFTDRMILAAEIDYVHMSPAWELAVADLAESRSAAAIARSSKGILDSIGERPAVALRDDSYVVELGNKRLGAMAPANRQSVARWLREARSRTAPTLSPYLKGTLVASDKSQIVMAFNLEDAIPPDVIRAKLAASEVAKKLDLDAAAKALASIRGLAVEVAVTDVASGRLRIHFGGDATPLAAVAQPLLLEILGDLDARIGDVESWQVTAEKQRITFEGPLTTAGMRRVLALIDSPTSAILASDARQDSQANQAEAKAQASQQYFRSLMSVLDDLRSEANTAKTFGQNALWFDKWARRIDRMPIQNVDEELLGFGRAVSTALRSMAGDMRGVGIHSAAQNAQTVASNYSYYADWFYVDAQQRAVRAQERAKGVLSARDTYQAIENEAARIRQGLSERYKVAF